MNYDFFKVGLTINLTEMGRGGVSWVSWSSPFCINNSNKNIQHYNKEWSQRRNGELQDVSDTPVGS